MSVELQYREILPQRSIDDSSFAKGVQNFIFSLGHPTSAIMSKSYLRFQVEVNSDRTANTPPLMKDLIAIADGGVANAYNNCQFYCGGRQVSQCITGCPQASALKNRLLNSGAWIETVGTSVKNIEGEFAKRQQQVCFDAQNLLSCDQYGLLHSCLRQKRNTTSNSFKLTLPSLYH